MDVNLSDPIPQATMLFIIVDMVAIAIVAVAIHKAVKKSNPSHRNP